MVALKTHKTLQHVSIHYYIILRELVCSLLKSLIKTVRSQICGNAAALPQIWLLTVLISGFIKEHTSSLRMI
jgi:hypothetical protein